MSSRISPLLKKNQDMLIKTWERSALLDEDSSIVQRISTLEKLSNPIVPELSFELTSAQLKLKRKWVVCSQSIIPRTAWTNAFQALLELHKIDIVHWDVRPSNLIWDGEQIWLIDWEPSLQQIRNERSQLICSPDWMAPSDLGNTPSQLSDIIGLVSSYFHQLTEMTPDVNLRQSWEDISFSKALSEIDSQLF